MSNIYITEPPTNGKVLIVTTVGDIDVELWAKETPKACRNFVQLCMEGYYDGTIFHRLVPGFIVQGGDPEGNGEGGESIYGKPFKDEFHSRLRFTRRGLLGMANAGPHDNGSQFFFTLGAAPELNNKHTLFGKVMGDTLYNMLRLEEMEVGSNERPRHPHKILKTQILSNPFDDIIPRQLPKRQKDDKKSQKRKSKSKATKNYKLLSFGEEAEQDEEEVLHVSEKNKGKSKSSHDLLDDKTLSSVPVIKNPMVSQELDYEEPADEHQPDPVVSSTAKDQPSSDTDSSDAEDESHRRLEKLRKEARQLKKELRGTTKDDKKEVTDKDAAKEEKVASNDMLASFKEEQAKYKKKGHKKVDKKKRENQTLELLASFKNKMKAVKDLSNYSDDEKSEPGDEEDQGNMAWLSHKLETDDTQNKVLDANVYDSERYELHDPRNPITKRRLDASKKKMRESKKMKT